MMRLAGLALVLVSSACSSERPLTVVGWGGASQDAHRNAYWTSFAQQSGIALQEDSWHGGIGVIRAKMHGGDPHWDVVQVEVEELILGCEERLFARIDWRALGGREAFIDGASHDCGVGSMVGSYLLGYDGDRLQDGPQSWADFWDLTRFPGKRGMRKTAKYTLEIALLADGVAPENVYGTLRTPAGLARAFAKLDRLKPHAIWYASSSQVPDLLASGEVIMAVATPGRLVMANRLERRNFRLVWPGNLYSIDFWAVLARSPRSDEALRLLAYITQPGNQARLPNFIPAGVTRKAAVPLVDAAIVADTPSHPDNLRGALALDPQFWVENADRLNQRFSAWASQ